MYLDFNILKYRTPLRGWSDSIVGESFILHKADPVLVPGSPSDPHTYLE